MTDDLHCATVSVRGVVSGPDNTVLLLRRASDEQWELPGGRLASGEQPTVGLTRECREETGLSVEINALCGAHSWVNDAGQDRFAVYYACEVDTTAVTLSEEHRSAQWVSPAEAESLLSADQLTAVSVAMTSTPQSSSMAALGSLSVE